MASADTGRAGSVVSLWRYPVKSMMGEELNAAQFAELGLVGDRAFALVDRETGKVASAKQPRKWAQLFECRAAYIEPPGGNGLPPVRLTLPDGTIVTSGEADIDRRLSGLFQREVVFTKSVPDTPSLEEYWPDIEGLAHREEVTDEEMPPGTFFDLATVHVLTTATINRLRELYPEGRFEVRRFRPNVVVELDSGASGFAENDWIGRTLAVGDEIRLKVTGGCPRCVMTTLPQGDLPKDPGILRAAAQHNDVNVGVYASVSSGGSVRRGDRVTIE
jgi:uncharacterized protein YcbX